jgi:peptidyl-prolyl cis-trans isomerase C
MPRFCFAGSRCCVYPISDGFHVYRRPFFIRLRDVATLLTLALATSCNNRSPDGEVLAVVDGESLTRNDLAADLAAHRLSPEAVDNKMQSAVMAALIDRKLLAERARQEALDMTPDYLAAATRAEETALVQQLLGKWRTTVPPPSRSDVLLFMDQNPQMFANRVVYLLDELQTDAKGPNEKTFGSLRSMEEVIDYLRQADHPFRRGSATLDTLTMGPNAARRVARLAPGEPFASTSGATLIIRAVVRSSPAPLVDDQGIRIATQLLERATFQRLVEQKIKTLHAAATITYPAAPVPAG